MKCITTESEEMMANAGGFLRQGNDKFALEIIDGLYAKNPDFLDGYARLGGIKREEKDWESARLLMERDLSVGRMSDDWQLRYAEVLMELGEEQRAVEIVAEVYATKPDAQDGYARLGWVRTRHKDWPGAQRLMEQDHVSERMSPQWCVHYAQAVARCGDEAAAIKLIGAAYAEDQGLRDGFARLGGYRREEQDWESARLLMERDLSVGRMSDDWQLRYAEVLMELGEEQRAVEIVAEVYATKPDAQDGYARLGWVRTRHKDWPGAQRLMEQDHVSERMSPQWCVHYAQAVARCGDEAAAIKLIGAAYDEDQGLRDGFARIGWIYRVEGRWADARRLMCLDHQQGRMTSAYVLRYAKLLGEYGETSDAMVIIADVVNNRIHGELSTAEYMLASQVLFFLHAYRTAKKVIIDANNHFPDSVDLLVERQRQNYVRATMGWLGLQDITGVELNDSEMADVSEYSWKNIINEHKKIAIQVDSIPYDAYTYASQSVLHEADRYWKLGDAINATQILCDGAAMLGVGLHADSMYSLVTPVLAVRHHRMNTNEYKSAIFRWLNEASDTITCLGWLFVYDFLVWHGHFEGALIAWQKAIQSAYSEFKVNPDNENKITRAIRASITVADFDMCDKLLEKLKTVNKNTYIEFEAYATMNRGDTMKIIALRKKQGSAYGDKYHNLIAGKSVAIVGPAPTNELCGEEIDSFDVVVRFCYQGESAEPQNIREYGSKTNVSYYAKNTFFGWDKEKRKVATNKLGFYLLDNIEPDCADFVGDVESGRAGMSLPNSRMFHKYPNAMQRILYDVLRYEPSRVKLFKTNFYFSKDVYQQEHLDIVKSSLPRQESGLVRHQAWAHDLLSQLAFVRNLRDSGVIEVDDICGEVLSISTEHYMKQMEIHHGCEVV